MSHRVDLKKGKYISLKKSIYSFQPYLWHYLSQVISVGVGGILPPAEISVRRAPKITFPKKRIRLITQKLGRGPQLRIAPQAQNFFGTQNFCRCLPNKITQILKPHDPHFYGLSGCYSRKSHVRAGISPHPTPNRVKNYGYIML